MNIRMGERKREGHFRAFIQLMWGACWERSERKVPKKNCIPNAAVSVSTWCRRDGGEERTVVANVVIHEQSHLDHHPISGFHVRRCEQHNVDQECTLQQGKQSPLIVVVDVPGTCPGRNHVEDQHLDRLANVRRDVGGCVIQPPSLHPVRHLKYAKLADKPYENCSYRCRQQEPGYSAERALRNAAKSSFLVSRRTLSNGL